MFSKITLGNPETCRTEAEISDDSGNSVAVVYEAIDGWHIELCRTIRAEEMEQLDAIIQTAKNDLSHYVNRKGLNVPTNLTVGDLSLWLLLKDDGTALGIRLSDLENS